MKKIFMMLMIVLALVNCSNREIDWKKLQNRNGVYFMPNEDKPFTGIVVATHDNGQVKSRSNYKDGNLHGEWTGYYNNGQVESKSNYKDGNLHGEQIEYYNNGQVESKSNYKDGNLHGDRITYYDNGLVKLKSNYKDGMLQ